MSSVMVRERAWRGPDEGPAALTGPGGRASAPPSVAPWHWVDENELMVILTDSRQSRLISRR
jgi:hypothetical protein